MSGAYLSKVFVAAPIFSVERTDVAQGKDPQNAAHPVGVCPGEVRVLGKLPDATKVILGSLSAEPFVEHERVPGRIRVKACEGLVSLLRVGTSLSTIILAS